jgi:hypothetical protein
LSEEILMKKVKAAIFLMILSALMLLPAYTAKADTLLWSSDVSSNGTPVNSPVLQSGVTYRIKAYGTFFNDYYPAEDLTQSIFVDAQYYTTPPYDTSGLVNYYWTWATHYQPNGHSFLQINAQDVDWGPFSNGGWDPVNGLFGHEYEIYYVGEGAPIAFSVFDWLDLDYTDNMCHITVEIYWPCDQNPKQFTGAYSLDGFAPPEITDNGLGSVVTGLKSGPRVSWAVTYYFANDEAYLGSQYDGQAHYFRLWDKWGGNLMVLGAVPTAFNPAQASVTVGGTSFVIDYAGYSSYIGDGLDFTDSRGRDATATLHTGDQQEKTNPGKGKGTNKDGKAYDVDLVWDIGYLLPGESSTLTIIVAPGMNPGGKLEFTSCGFTCINTGPRTRVYADADYNDFLYAIDRTIQLGVLVQK